MSIEATGHVDPTSLKNSNSECHPNQAEETTADASNLASREMTTPLVSQTQEETPATAPQERGPSFSTYSRYKPSPYRVLGVSATATSREITACFRRQALQEHPDRSARPRQEAEERFKRLNDAYQLLRDEGRRRDWDERWPALLQQERKDRCTRVAGCSGLFVLNDGQRLQLKTKGLLGVEWLRPTGRKGVLFRNRWFARDEVRQQSQGDYMRDGGVFFSSGFGDIFTSMFFEEDEWSDGSEEEYDEFQEFAYDPFSFGFSANSIFDVFFSESPNNYSAFQKRSRKSSRSRDYHINNRDQHKNRNRSREFSQTRNNRSQTNMPASKQKNNSAKSFKNRSYSHQNVKRRFKQPQSFQNDSKMGKQHQKYQSSFENSSKASHSKIRPSASKRPWKPTAQFSDSMKRGNTKKQEPQKPRPHSNRPGFESKKDRVEKIKKLLRQRKQESSK